MSEAFTSATVTPEEFSGRRQSVSKSSTTASPQSSTGERFTLDVPEFEPAQAAVLTPAVGARQTDRYSASRRSVRCAGTATALVFSRIAVLVLLLVGFNQEDAFSYTTAAGYTITIGSTHYSNVSRSGDVIFDYSIFGQSGANFTTPPGYGATSGFELATGAAVVGGWGVLGTIFVPLYVNGRLPPRRIGYLTAILCHLIVSFICLALLLTFVRAYHHICTENGAVSSQLLTGSRLLFAAVGLEWLTVLLLLPSMAWDSYHTQPRLTRRDLIP